MLVTVRVPKLPVPLAVTEPKPPGPVVEMPFPLTCKGWPPPPRVPLTVPAKMTVSWKTEGPIKTLWRLHTRSRKVAVPPVAARVRDTNKSFRCCHRRCHLNRQRTGLKAHLAIMQMGRDLHFYVLQGDNVHTPSVDLVSLAI